VGDKQNQPFQLSFNPCLKVDFQGSRVTSDGGLLLVRELDERLGLSALIAQNIMDDRRGKNMQLPLPDLLRQSIYSRLAGYEDVNDAERLSQDPTFRLIGSEKIWDRGAALPSRLHWFTLSATETLAPGQVYNYHFDTREIKKPLHDWRNARDAHHKFHGVSGPRRLYISDGRRVLSIGMGASSGR
jgi:hypothetical protein